MAQFKISLPNEVRADILQTRKEVDDKVGTGQLPPYELFVWNLAKSMQTPAEELHHASTGMSGEAGEILDVSKKVWVYNKPLDVKHLIEELGDLRFYYQATLNMLGITDAEIIAANMKKLDKRYADGKYSDEQAIARADKAPLSADGRTPGFLCVNCKHPYSKDQDGSCCDNPQKPQPAPRKFMGMVPPAPQDNEVPDPKLPQMLAQQRDRVRDELEKKFDQERDASLRQLRKDERL